MKVDRVAGPAKRSSVVRARPDGRNSMQSIQKASGSRIGSERGGKRERRGIDRWAFGLVASILAAVVNLSSGLATDYGQWQTLRTLTGHTDDVFSVSWSGDGLQLASGSADQTIKIWDTQTWEARTLRGHTAEVIVVGWSPDSSQL